MRCTGFAVFFFLLLVIIFGCSEVVNQPDSVTLDKRQKVDSLYAAGSQLFQTDPMRAAAMIDSAVLIGYENDLASMVGPWKVKMATFDIYYGREKLGRDKLYEVLHHPATPSDTTLAINVLSEITQYHLYYGSLDSADYYLQQQRHYLDSLQRPGEYANYLHRRAEIKRMQGVTYESIEDFISALSLYDQYGNTALDSSHVVGILVDLGVLLHDTNETLRGYEYLKRALTFFSPGEPGYGVVAARTAVLAADIGEVVFAQKLIEQVEDQSDVSPNDLYLTGLARSILLLESDNYQSAYRYLGDLSNRFPEFDSDPGNRFRRLELQFEALVAMGRYDDLIVIIEEMEKNAQSDILRAEYALYDSKAAVLTGNAAQKQQALREIESLRDSVNLARYQIELADLETQYQNSLKDAQIAEQDAALSASTLRFQRLAFGLVLLVVITLALIGGLFLFRRNNRRLRLLNDQLTTQKETIGTLNRELSHRVKNNLAFITSMFRMQGRRTENQEARALLEQMEGRLMTLNTAHELLQDASEKHTLLLADYMEDVIANLQSFHSNQEHRLLIQRDVDQLPLSMKQTMYLGLIVNELVSNTVKHTQPIEGKRKATLMIKSKGETAYHLTYFDHERNIPDWRSTVHSVDLQSLGTKLIDLLTAQIEAELEIVDGIVRINGNVNIYENTQSIPT